ncbi:MAG TPA: hypothetical protein VGL82_19290 [Bryobacteraceae bacterium]|jgi:hypothetical protein
MSLSSAAACLAAVALCAPLHASIMPTFHLDQAALQTFETYVAQFEKNVATPYAETGKMWIDTDACCIRNGAFASGKAVLQARENTDIAGGSIHHYSGVIHVAGGTIADVRHIMQDYVNYPKYFKPDVGKGSGVMNPDSTPEDEHFTSQLSLIQSTLWIGVSYDCVYDTHYRLYDPHHWASLSSTVSVKEWQDPKDVRKGYYPEGDDHGFLWRTQTFWFVRENNGGVDLELDSMSLSRPIPTGFAWWGSKRTKDAVDKMLLDMKAAVEALHRPGAEKIN